MIASTQTQIRPVTETNENDFWNQPISWVLNDEYGVQKAQTEHKYWINEYMLFAYWNENDYGFWYVTSPDETRQKMRLLASILHEEIPHDISKNNVEQIIKRLRIVAQQHKDKTLDELSQEYRESLGR